MSTACSVQVVCACITHHVSDLVYTLQYQKNPCLQYKYCRACVRCSHVPMVEPRHEHSLVMTACPDGNSGWHFSRVRAIPDNYSLRFPPHFSHLTSCTLFSALTSHLTPHTSHLTPLSALDLSLLTPLSALSSHISPLSHHSFLTRRHLIPLSRLTSHHSLTSRLSLLTPPSPLTSHIGPVTLLIISSRSDPAFFGAIGAADIVYRKRRVGVFGVVHPEVLEYYKIKSPCGEWCALCMLHESVVLSGV